MKNFKDALVTSAVLGFAFIVGADMWTQNHSRDASIAEAKKLFQITAALIAVPEGQYSKFKNISWSGLFKSEDVLVVKREGGKLCLRLAQTAENTWHPVIDCVPLSLPEAQRIVSDAKAVSAKTPTPQ